MRTKREIFLILQASAQLVSEYFIDSQPSQDVMLTLAPGSIKGKRLEVV